jgi:hypothetical protein
MSAPEQCILGLDPGLSGAIAFYSPVHPELIVAEDMPVAGGEVDAATLARRIAQMAPTIAVIERVGAMPKQGVASTFKFGVAFGMARAVVSALGIPTHLVAPSRWKKAFSTERRQRDGQGARTTALAGESAFFAEERS